MSAPPDPPRLALGGEGVPADLSRALGAARARVPGEGVLSAVAARLPPGPGGGGPGGGAPADGGATGGLGAGAGAPLAAAPSVWSGVFVGTVMGAAVGVGSLFVPVGPSAPPGSIPAVSVAASAPSTAVLAPPSVRPALAAAPEPERPSAAPPGSAPPAQPAVSAGAEGSASSAPAEPEVDYLRRAHGLLSSSPSQALALAEAHPLRYPDGKLSQEREMIVVGALAALGRAADAESRARQFLARFPDSAHRRRLEVLVPALHRRAE